MKSYRAMMLVCLLAGSIVGSNSFGSVDRPKQSEKIVGLSDVFIPGGFSSESEAYVVTNGIFPNGCYSWKRAEVDHKSAAYHEVKTYANISEGMCLMVLLPFTKEVTLGKLSPGNHRLRFINGDGTYIEKNLKIEQ